MKTYHLRAVIVRVTRGDKVVTTQTFGYPDFETDPAWTAAVEPDASDPIFRSIGAYLAPSDPPPTKK